MHIEVFEPKETAIGELFWKWLREGLMKGELAINKSDAGVYSVREGILLAYSKIFEDFSRAYSQHRDWIVAFQQFNMLGLTKLSGDDYRFTQYFSEYPAAKAGMHGHPNGGNLPGLFAHPEQARQQATVNPQPLSSVQNKSTAMEGTGLTQSNPLEGYTVQGVVLKDASLLLPRAKTPAADQNLQAKHPSSEMHDHFANLQDSQAGFYQPVPPDVPPH